MGSSLQDPKPVAAVSGLLAPTDDAPWTIVGSVYKPDTGHSVAAVWSSDNGQSWDRHDIDPGDGDRSEMFAAVADSELGRLAVGSVGDGERSDAAVWRAGDDGNWARLAIPEMGGEHQQWAFDLAAGAGGVLVAGGESVWGEVRPRLWFSADGETWEVVDGGPGGPFDTTGHESIGDIAAFGDGFVAVGSRTVDHDKDGVAWYSADGRQWEQVEAPGLGGPGRQALQSLAVAGDALVAGGYTTDLAGRGVPVIWRSDDGRQWGQHSDPLPLHDSARTDTADLAVRTISVGGDGLVAAGGTTWRPHMWRSNDGGRNWLALPDPVGRGLFEDGVLLAGAATHGDTTVAVGLEPTVMRLAGDRWQDATGDAFPKGGERPIATAVAVGSKSTIVGGARDRAPAGERRARRFGQVWAEDGGGWSALETDQLNAGQINDVMPYRDGFIAIGVEDFGVADKRTACDNGLPDGLIWVSEDGTDWKRVGANIASVCQDLIPFLAENPDEDLPNVIAQTLADQPFETAPPAGGEGSQLLDAVAPLGDGFVAVGVQFDNGDVQPIVVTSGDGSALVGEDPHFGGPGTQRFWDVCAAPDGIVIAVGIEGGEGAYDVAVRRRGNGERHNWGAAEAEDGSFEGPGSQQAYACAASEDGYVMVGSDDGSGDADARVWVSEDGESWTRVESGLLGGAGDQRARAVAPVPEDQGGGWLIGGSDSVDGDRDAALWRLSPDGEITRRDTGEPELGGPGDQSVYAIAIDGGHVTIVGEDYGRAGVWESDRIDR